MFLALATLVHVVSAEATETRGVILASVCSAAATSFSQSGCSDKHDKHTYLSRAVSNFPHNMWQIRLHHGHVCSLRSCCVGYWQFSLRQQGPVGYDVAIPSLIVSFFGFFFSKNVLFRVLAHSKKVHPFRCSILTTIRSQKKN